MSGKALTVYTSEGKTFRFEDVSDVRVDGVGLLEFDYVSASRHVPVHASFSLNSPCLIGYSLDK